MAEPWPDACLGHYKQIRLSPGMQIVKDINPYQAVAVDVATGKAPRITSRSHHREFLKRNGYIEVGNEMPKQRERDYADISNRDVRQVFERLRDR